MSFATALALTLLLAVFVLAAAMANLLARITRLERFAAEALGMGGPQRLPLTGIEAPAEVRRVARGADDVRLVFVSPRCPACDDAVEGVGTWPEDVRRTTYLLYRDDPADDLVAPAGVRVVPGAADAFDSLSIASTPAFVRVEGGTITERSPSGVGGTPHVLVPEGET